MHCAVISLSEGNTPFFSHLPEKRVGAALSDKAKEQMQLTQEGASFCASALRHSFLLKVGRGKMSTFSRCRALKVPMGQTQNLETDINSICQARTHSSFIAKPT